MGSAQLTHRMPCHHVRPHTPRLQQPVESHLVSEESRLSESRTVQALPVPHHLTQRQPKRLDHLIQRPREHRERVIQLAPHTRALAPLPGEHERRPALHRRPTGDHPGEPTQQLLAIPAHHNNPVLQHAPRRSQREPDIQRRQILPPGHVPGQPLRLRPQRTLTTPRQHPRNDRQRRRSFLFCLFLNRRCFLQDDVRVRPADTEGRHTRPARTPTLNPGPGLRQELHRPRRPVHVRRRLLRMQGPRQHPVPHRHHHLDHTGDTRSRLRVPDVRLERPQPQRRTVLGPLLPVRGQQRLRLDRVTQRGARAVCLHRVHVRGAEPRSCQRLPDHPLLRRTVRRREAAGGAVLVHGRAPHHREHPVPVAPCVRQALDHEHAHALGPTGAVRTGRERLAAAVRGERPLAAVLDEHVRLGHDGDAADEGQGALAAPQRLSGQVQADQGRRAGGVDRHGRALQAQGVGDATGDDAGDAARREVRLQVLGDGRTAGAVVAVHDAAEDAGAAAPE